MKPLISKIQHMLHLSKMAYSFLMAMLLSNTSFSQAHITMSMRNITATNNTIEYDLYVINDGNTSVKLSACSYGINFNAAILNGGTLTSSYVNKSRGDALKGLTAFSLASKRTTEINQIRMTTTPCKLEIAAELVPNVPFKVGRFKISNTEEWTHNSDPSFSLQEQTKIGFTTTQVVAYIGTSTKLTALTPFLNTVKTEVEKSPVLNAEVPSSNTSANIHANTLPVNANAGNSNSTLTALHQEATMTLYPNPAINTLYVEINHPYTAKATFKLLDVLGKLISQERIDLIEGANKLHVEVDELNSGIYFIKIQDEEGKQYSQRFAKQ